MKREAWERTFGDSILAQISNISWSQPEVNQLKQIFRFSPKTIWGEYTLSENCVKLVWKIPDRTLFFEPHQGRSKSSTVDRNVNLVEAKINEAPRLTQEIVASKLNLNAMAVSRIFDHLWDTLKRLLDRFHAFLIDVQKQARVHSVKYFPPSVWWKEFPDLQAPWGRGNGELERNNTKLDN